MVLDRGVEWDGSELLQASHLPEPEHRPLPAFVVAGELFFRPVVQPATGPPGALPLRMSHMADR